MSAVLLLALAATEPPTSGPRLAARVFVMPAFAPYSQVTAGLGADVGARVRPWLLVGGSAEFAGADKSDNGCWYQGRCVFGWGAIAPFVQVEANADGVVVPYARLTAGPAALISGSQRAPDQPLTVMAAPELGLDLNVSRLRFGAFAGMRLMLRNELVGGFGLRLAYDTREW